MGWLLAAKSAGSLPQAIPRTSPAELVAVLLASSASTLWCLPRLRGLVDAGDGLIYPGWSDGFVHASRIALFGGEAWPLEMGHFELVGEALRPYQVVVPAIPAPDTGDAAGKDAAPGSG